MEISAAMVMELRNRMGISMMACKKALVEAGGDMEKAIEILRKSGEAKAASKADRETHEGRVFIAADNDKVAVVQIRCETDFVSSSNEFVMMGKQLADTALREGKAAAEVQADQLIKAAIVKIGENIQLENIEVLHESGKTLGYYVHLTNKLAGVVYLENGTADQARDVAMQVIASNPQYLSPEEVSTEMVAKEMEIAKEVLRKEGKPEQIIEKILEGKTKKFREENALITQSFIKDPSQTISQYLGNARVVRYGYYKI